MVLESPFEVGMTDARMDGGTTGIKVSQYPTMCIHKCYVDNDYTGTFANCWNPWFRHLRPPFKTIFVCENARFRPKHVLVSHSFFKGMREGGCFV